MMFLVQHMADRTSGVETSISRERTAAEQRAERQGAADAQV